MPIEFYCPGCGNLMRTPDETAGRKGRCPTCQTKVAIPRQSVKAGDEIRPRQAEVKKVAPQQSQSADSIQFKCGSCDNSLSIPSANAGKKGKCPHCGAVMSIPLRTNLTAPSSPSKASQNARWKGRPEQRAAAATSPTATPVSSAIGKIEFHCSRCSKVVRVGAAAAGQQGQCPNCKSVIRIPMHATATTPAAMRAASPRPSDQASSGSGLTPIGGGLTPLGGAGLTPIDSGLTPLGGAGLTPIDSGLTPLGGAGLTPLGDSGLQPLDAGLIPLDGAGVSPFGSPDVGGGTSDPLRLGGMSASAAPSSNPYAASAPAISTPVRHSHKPKGGPSGALVTLGVLLVLVGAGNLMTLGLSLVLEDVDAKLENIYQKNGVQNEAERKGLKAFALTLRYGSSLIMAAGSALSIAGGIQTTRQKSRGLCFAGSVFAILPCGCFCILGIPVGIWGLIMLSQDSVRRGFS